ncbi:MAG: NAD(P)-dependent oxidoreductase [Ktedonobacteraceae bacterium]|nr:NAD(P)-dependent oxidoreductase [Ktedonobacteraceae bacterium]
MSFDKLLAALASEGGKDMRILITGSSGYLGSAIAQLLAINHEPVGIDVAPGPWTQHVVDITDRSLMGKLVKGIDAIIHIASLHQPHLVTHSSQQFLAINVTGTLNMLEAAVQNSVRRFVYTSTTSLYGHALVPQHKAVWVTEDLPPRPRDIYDHTKVTAERLCRHFALHKGLPTICLRVARFFPEPAEIQVVHRLYRSVDVRDAAVAHLLAAINTTVLFDIMNISASSPFLESDTPMLLRDAAAVIRARVPTLEPFFACHGWKLPTSIDRVYVSERARRQIRYNPLHNFSEYLQEIECI